MTATHVAFRDGAPAYEIRRFATEAEWLAARHDIITASDVAAVLGLSPFESAYALFCRKVGILPPTEENRAMRRGKVIEPFAADEYARENPTHTLLDLGRHTLIVSRRYPHLGASLDRILVAIDDLGDAGLEIKSAARSDSWKDSASPEHYAIQCHTGMAVTGFAWWLLCGYLMGSDELKTVPFYYDEDIADAIVEQTAEFHAMVMEGRALMAQGIWPTWHPSIDESESSRDALRARYRDQSANEEALVLEGHEIEVLEEQWALAAAAEKEAKEIQEFVKGRLMQLMADRTVAVLPGGTKVTWKTVTKKAHMRKETSNREMRRYSAKES